MAQVKLQEEAAAAQEPREVYDFRGNKKLDLGFAVASSATPEGLTWNQLKAVRHSPLPHDNIGG